MHRREERNDRIDLRGAQVLSVTAVREELLDPFLQCHPMPPSRYVEARMIAPECEKSSGEVRVDQQGEMGFPAAIARPVLRIPCGE